MRPRSQRSKGSAGPVAPLPLQLVGLAFLGWCSRLPTVLGQSRFTPVDNLTRAEIAEASAAGDVGYSIANITLPVNAGGQFVGVRRWTRITFEPVTNRFFAAPTDADAVLAFDPASGNVSLVGALGQGCAKWSDVVFAPVTQKLYFCPYGAVEVLVVNPATDAWDVSALGGLGSEQRKWNGVAYAEVTRKIYAVPFSLAATAVLIVDPVLNTTDVTAIGGLSQVGWDNDQKWWGLTYVPTTQKLVGAPYGAKALLVIDPVTNASDVSIGTPSSANHLFRGVVFAAITNKLYFATFNADALLVFDPVTNATDRSTFPIALDLNLFNGIAYSDATNRIYLLPNPSTPGNALWIVDPLSNTTDTTSLPTSTVLSSAWVGVAFGGRSASLVAAPHNLATLLRVDTLVDESVLLRTRLRLVSSVVDTLQRNLTAVTSIVEQSGLALSAAVAAVASLNASLQSTQSTVLEQRSVIAAQNASLLALEAGSASVCSRPLCGNGTAAVNGVCLPDCPALRQRRVACEPHCAPLAGVSTAAPTVPTQFPTTPTTPPTTGAQTTTLVIVAVVATVVAVTVAACVVVAWRRRRSTQREQMLRPEKASTTAMFVNPLHSRSPVGAVEYEEPAVSLQHDSAPPVGLDAELYVSAGISAPSADVDGPYSVFRSEAQATESEALATYTTFLDRANSDATA